MNRFLYSGNFKLNLLLPRHVKSFLSLKPCLALGRTHTHIHTTRESWCSELTGQHTVKTTGLDASIVDKISQCLGLRSTTIFTKCNYQTCFISKARRCSPFNSRPSWKQCFTKSDKNHLKQKRLLVVFYLLRTPSQIQYVPPSPWFPSSQVHTLVEKKTTKKQQKHWFQKWGSLVDEEGRGRRPS